MTLYEELTSLGIEVEGSASDLYVRDSEQVRQILAKHPDQTRRASTFLSGPGVWWDVPFAYDPWWEGKNLSTKLKSCSVRDVQ